VHVLLITLDQFRGDSYGAAGHPLVRTPALDELAAHGVRLARHYSQAAPCSPGRASLYTGMYQMNHRVVANGTPLDSRFDNVAKAARRVGYDPVLFGYTDQSMDPRDATGPDDPRMQHYSGILPGFRAELHIPDDHQPWMEWLSGLGYTDLGGPYDALGTEPSRPAEHSLSAFMTDRVVDWLGARPDDQPWFAHLSYLRPHPPYSAAGHFATMYDPADVEMPIAAGDHLHPSHRLFLQVPDAAAPTDEAGLRHMRAQYYGMISEVDSQLARVWQALRDHRMWDDTLIIVTADHGEQLGDHGLQQKLGWFEQSYHTICVVRHPGHPEAHVTAVAAFTENVDLFPTVCDAIGAPVPVQCDGLPLTPFLAGEDPPWWRTAAHYEYDWRDAFIDGGPHEWPWDRRLERQHVVTLRTTEAAYVQFADGSSRCYDLAADPTWRTEVTDPAVVLRLAQEMLVWRSRHADRTLTDMLVRDGGVGRFPTAPMFVETALP